MIDRDVSVRTVDVEPRGCELLYALRPKEEGDIAAGRVESRAKVAAQGSRAYDEDSHWVRVSHEW